MIRCESLEKRYGKKKILTHVSFEIEEPKIIGLIGRNGVGKSTLLKLLAGHLKATGGELEVVGQKPYQNLTVAANTILIEETMIFPSVLTVEEILKEAKTFYMNFALDLAKELLHYVGIAEKNYHHQLSKGQTAAFNLIYGLATRTAITLLDEPMNGLDESIRDDLYRVILKEYIAYPRLIIMSSHYLQEMAHLIEDILLIHNGQVELFAPIEEVQQLAVKLIGQREHVEPYLHKLDVIARRDNPPLYEAIVRPFSTPLPDTIRLQALSASEVISHMTNDKERSIDDIYR